MQEKCKDCKGTGELWTEGIKLGRPYYSKEHKQIVTPYETDGKWKKSICHCLSDKETE